MQSCWRRAWLGSAVLIWSLCCWNELEGGHVVSSLAVGGKRGHGTWLMTEAGVRYGLEGQHSPCTEALPVCQCFHTSSCSFNCLCSGGLSSSDFLKAKYHRPEWNTASGIHWNYHNKSTLKRQSVQNRISELAESKLCNYYYLGTFLKGLLTISSVNQSWSILWIHI